MNLQSGNIIFIAENQEFILNPEIINRLPSNSFFPLIIRSKCDKNKDDDKIILDNVSAADFQELYDYITREIIPSDEVILSYFHVYGLSLTDNYQISLVPEEYLRQYMYQKGYEKDPINSDPYFMLTKVNESYHQELISHISSHPRKDHNLLFDFKSLNINSWGIITKKLKEFSFLFTRLNHKHLFIAGGKIFTCFFESKSPDIDLFLYNTDEEDANCIIDQLSGVIDDYLDLYGQRVSHFFNDRREIHESRYQKRFIEIGTDNGQSRYQYYRENDNDDEYDLEYDNEKRLERYKFLQGVAIVEKIKDANYRENESRYPLKIIRTANAITFTLPKIPYIKELEGLLDLSNGLEIQVILRLYRSPAEILYGFDIDSCALGYDGIDVWATPRAIYALKNQFNTVNFERMSPSYSYRLVKYGLRGMAIRIPPVESQSNNNQGLDGEQTIKQQIVFQRDNIDQQRLKDYYQYYLKYIGTDDYWSKVGYVRLNRLQGLDSLILLEYETKQAFEHQIYNKHKNYTEDRIQRLGIINSDYNPRVNSFKYGGSYINRLLTYLYLSADKYPQSSQRYIPLIKRLMEQSAVLKKIIIEEVIREENNKLYDGLHRGIEKDLKNLKKKLIRVYGSSIKIGLRIDKAFNDYNHNNSAYKIDDFLHKRFSCSPDKKYLTNKQIINLRTKLISYDGDGKRSIRRLNSEDDFNQLTFYRFDPQGNALYINHQSQNKIYDNFFTTAKVSSLDSKTFSFIRVSPDQIENLFEIPEDLYNILNIVKPCEFPRLISYKTINPGAQTTGTFQKLVLENPSIWYQTYFYQSDKQYLDDQFETKLFTEIDQIYQKRLNNDRVIKNIRDKNLDSDSEEEEDQFLIDNDGINLILVD